MRVVFDTNIYICSILSAKSQSAPCQLIDLARENQFDLFICSEILQEIHHVLFDKLNFEEKIIQEILSEISFFTQQITVTERVDVSKDPDDNVFLSLSKQIKADYLVSLDTKHLIVLKKFENTKIVYPSDFLRVLG